MTRMTMQEKKHEQLVTEMEDLRLRFDEANRTLEAIRRGEVDAIVVSGPDGEQTYMLTDADKQYRIMVEDMQDGAIMLDEHGAIVYCNNQATQILGVSHQQIMGNLFCDLVTPVSRSIFEALLLVGRAQEVRRAEIVLCAASGRLVPALAALRRLSIGGKNLVSLIITDLTELKQHEEMSASAALSNAILDQTADAVVVCDTGGKIFRANQNAHHLCGENPIFMGFCDAFTLYRERPHEMATGRSVEELPVCELFSFPSAGEDSPPRGNEFFLYDRDGLDGRHRRYFLVSAGSLRDNHDHPLGWVVTMVDITARKQAERELQLRERWHRQIVDSIPQLVWTSLPDGNIDYCNNSWLGFTGMTLEQTQGQGWMAALHPSDLEHTSHTWEEALRRGDKYEVEHRLRRRSGEYHWFLTRALPLRDESGKVVKWYGSNTDIEEKKRTEEALAKAKAIAEAASFAKTRFLATMSHDLRTPLNSIIGFTELLLDDLSSKSLDPRQKEYLTHVASSGHHLLNLVEGLLNLSAIESGKIELKRTMIDLKAMLEELSVDYEFLAGKLGIKFVCNISITKPIRADRHRLWEVINNLVNNAMKYTPPTGTITLGASEGTREVSIFVKDTGVGIEENDFERIFTPFEQGRQPGVYGKGKSVGLGLAICRHLVELHGGKLIVQSAAGRGSCFTVTLPYVAKEIKQFHSQESA